MRGLVFAAGVASVLGAFVAACVGDAPTLPPSDGGAEGGDGGGGPDVVQPDGGPPPLLKCSVSNVPGIVKIGDYGDPAVANDPLQGDTERFVFARLNDGKTGAIVLTGKDVNTNSTKVKIWTVPLTQNSVNGIALPQQSIPNTTRPLWISHTSFGALAILTRDIGGGDFKIRKVNDTDLVANSSTFSGAPITISVPPADGGPVLSSEQGALAAPIGTDDYFVLAALHDQGSTRRLLAARANSSSTKAQVHNVPVEVTFAAAASGADVYFWGGRSVGPGVEFARYQFNAASADAVGMPVASPGQLAMGVLARGLGDNYFAIAEGDFTTGINPTGVRVGKSMSLASVDPKALPFTPLNAAEIPLGGGGAFVGWTEVSAQVPPMFLLSGPGASDGLLLLAWDAEGNLRIRDNASAMLLKGTPNIVAASIVPASTLGQTASFVVSWVAREPRDGGVKVDTIYLAKLACN
jgi:hypothetical protein